MKNEELRKELSFKAVRSSGAGGQHVNKVSSKVVLSFNIVQSEVLSISEKEQLYKTLSPRLTNDKVLILSCEESRSQQKNKQIVIDRFFKLIKQGLFVHKKRLKSKPSKASILRIKQKKKQRADLKKTRQKPTQY